MDRGVICDRCGGSAGEHGVGLCAYQPRKAGFGVTTDDVPGGFTVENAWPEPRTFYSQSAYEKALKADGMMLRPKHVPGGKLMNWATTDPQTLENARQLVSRRGSGSVHDEPLRTFQLTTRTLDDFSVAGDRT